MNRSCHALIGSVLFMLTISAFVPAVRASPWDKRTILTVNQAVEVPGAVLQPGKYVMKLMDLASTRNVVQIMNERENRVITTALTFPTYRMEPSDRTVMTFYEAPTGQPEALKTWYYPGDQSGQEFAYPKRRAAELARLTHQTVPSTDFGVRSSAPSSPAPESTSPPPAQTVAPEPAGSMQQGVSSPATPAPVATSPAEPEATVQNTQPARQETSPPASEPSVIAQNTPAPTPASEPAKNTELPRTASGTLTIALFGLGALAGGFALRKLRRRQFGLG